MKRQKASTKRKEELSQRGKAGRRNVTKMEEALMVANWYLLSDCSVFLRTYFPLFHNFLPLFLWEDMLLSSTDVLLLDENSI